MYKEDNLLQPYALPDIKSASVKVLKPADNSNLVKDQFMYFQTEMCNKLALNEVSLSITLALLLQRKQLTSAVQLFRHSGWQCPHSCGPLVYTPANASH